MSRVSLLPRLKAPGVDTLLKGTGEAGPDRVRVLDVLQENSALVSFGASGGTKNAQVAAEIARGLETLARECGYPQRGNSEQRARFDRLAAVRLAQEEALMSGEALRDDVWAFLTTAMAPDLVAWRFPERPLHRFAGGVRNAFQRLWVRGTVLDRGETHPDRWRLVEELTEDAMVQIFERASLSGNDRIARTIAEEWVHTADDIGRAPMEAVMRRATKLIRLRNEIIDLSFLPDPDLTSEIRTCFSRAITFHVAAEGRQAG